MTPDVIKGIAVEIVNETFILNWKFYFLLLAFFLLNIVVSSSVSSFFRKRAETAAIRRDFEELTDQLRKTTAVAEEVRTAISHSDWVAREWKVLRRSKLEELMASVYEIKTWLGAQQAFCLFDEPSPGESPISSIETLSRLYFPEIKEQTLSLTLVFYQQCQWLYEIKAEIHKTNGDAQKKVKILESQVSPQIDIKHRELLAAIASLEQVIPELMQEIAGI